MTDVEDRTAAPQDRAVLRMLQRSALQRLVKHLLVNAKHAPVSQSEHDESLAYVLIEQGALILLALGTSLTQAQVTAALPDLVGDLMREVRERHGT